MRISDWSSDVCSSDLTAQLRDAMSDLPLQTPDALRPLAQQCERQRYSPLTEPALLLDLNASASSDALFQDWLRTLPAPVIGVGPTDAVLADACEDRKSTRLNSSH